MTVLRKQTGAAFSLVELLTVIAILAILAAVGASAFRTGRGYNLVMGANLIIDELNLARQTALSQNRPVEMRLYNLPADVGGAQQFRAFRTMIYDAATATVKPLGKLKRLPTGVIMVTNPNFSTVLDPAANPFPAAGVTDTLPNANNVPYMAVPFLPSGGTAFNVNGTSATGDTWFISLKYENDPIASATRPAADFITIQIDPSTGRAKTFRP